MEGDAYDPSPEMCTDAVRAVRSLALRLGAVDMLVTEVGHYLLEVNVPFGFAGLDGVQVAGAIIDHLRRL